MPLSWQQQPPLFHLFSQANDLGAAALIPRQSPTPTSHQVRPQLATAVLEKYGFGPARSYLLVVDGKTYDSKAIVGAAHGYLADRQPLAPSDFSGGAATVGRVLTSLGFEVSQAGPGLTVDELVNSLSALRLYRSPDGRLALYQPLTLLWAIGRAHQDLPRLVGWDETKTLLGDFLERH